MLRQAGVGSDLLAGRGEREANLPFALVRAGRRLVLRLPWRILGLGTPPARAAHQVFGRNYQAACFNAAYLSDMKYLCLAVTAVLGALLFAQIAHATPIDGCRDNRKSAAMTPMTCFGQPCGTRTKLLALEILVPAVIAGGRYLPPLPAAASCSRLSRLEVSGE
jgi:hypothetical protein